MRTLAANPWMTTRQPPELLDDEVHIWKVDLDRVVAGWPALERSLSPDEHRRAKRFPHDRERYHYLLSCSVRRDILAGYLDTDPSDLKLHYGAKGEPELMNGAFHFNLTRSHRVAVCAVSRKLPVGVDVQRIRAGIAEEISGWFFSSRAIRFLEGLPQRQRQLAFFQAWSRMEAHAKALGAALTIDFENIEALLISSVSVFRGADNSTGESEMCWLHDFQPRAGYVGTLAVRSRGCKVKHWRWQTALGRSQLAVGDLTT
ncbi:MAG TPA: 4'-phosphopantetheinyl transferase superfamily protein [Bryobacteraceae bacterium]|nr:4'-phosphopantetheinyl transferase superfamily protein [Bryobacteraceae bacterium]